MLFPTIDSSRARNRPWAGWLLPLCAALALWALASAAALGAEPFRISDIRVEGLQRIAAGTVFNYLPVKVGDEVRPGETASIIRALYQTGFFQDIELEREGDVLIVSVRERPAIAKIEIEGNKDLETEQLLAGLRQIGLSEGQVFNRSLLDGIEQELRRQYFSRGKYALKLESIVTPLERNRVGIKIDISEGVSARIKQIAIVGNRAFDADDLLDEFESGTGGWFSLFSKRDQYSKETLAGDLERLRSYYLDRGYINFAVRSTQVSISPDRKDIFISISIDEGEPHTLSDIRLAGDLVVPPEELFDAIRLRRGEHFSRRLVTESSERLNQILGGHGYAFANVNAIPEINDADKSVALTFFVDPGKRVYVRRVNIKGNTRSRDEVLRREVEQMESAWFSGEQIKESRNRLQRLGYFEQVNIETPAVPGSADEVDVDVSVTEKSSGLFMAGVGYSQTQGVILNASISESNFFGTGKRVTIALNTSSAEEQYRLAYTNPYYTLDGVSRGFDLGYSRTDFSELNSANYAIDVGRAGINFGVPVTRRDQILFKLGFENTEFRVGGDPSTQVTNFAASNGNSFNDLRFGVTWVRDTRNSALFPTEGARQALILDSTLPGSDLNFYKLTYSHTRYFPLTRDLTLKLNGSIGGGDGYGDTEGLPFFYNFFAGGIRSVRGYAENSLGPRDSKGRSLGANGALFGQLELIFPPPVEDLAKSVRLSTFFDAGNVYELDADSGDYFDLSELRMSVGVAAAWVSPIGGIVISWGFPLNTQGGDREEQLQFNLGSTF